MSSTLPGFLTQSPKLLSPSWDVTALMNGYCLGEKAAGLKLKKVLVNELYSYCTLTGGQ